MYKFYANCMQKKWLCQTAQPDFYDDFVCFINFGYANLLSLQ